MTFDQISYFLAILEQGNFSRAADEIFISQSSLSKQIKALENELGVCLFTRNNYEIKMTDAGKVFSKFAIKVYKDYLDINDDLSSFKNKVDATFVKVGTIPILNYVYIINKIVNIEYRKKRIQVDLVEREQSEIIKMLERSQIDFAIIRMDYLPIYNYDFIPLMEEEIGIICSLKHHLASQNAVNLKDLKKESFFLLNYTSNINKLCLEAFKNVGYIPKIEYTSSRHEALLAMVNTGLGLTMLPKGLMNTENCVNLKYISINESINSNIALIWKKNIKINGEIKIFLNILRNCFKEYIANFENKNTAG